MFQKRAVALMLGLLLLLSANPLSALSEDITDEVPADYAVEDDNIAITDDAPDDVEVIVSDVQFPPLSHYTGEALYKGKVVINCTMRKEMNKDSAKIISVPDNAAIEILDIEPDWVLARYKGKVGYLRRLWIYLRPEAIDPVSTPPYGVYRYNYIGTCMEDTPIQKAPGNGQPAYLTLTKGARIAIIDVCEGWGRFYYWHGYGYVDISKLGDFQNVSPTDEQMAPGTPIAAYTSYYSIATNIENIGRMKNIVVACERISRVYQPGETFDFNKQVGPYSKGNGYFDAPVLVDGTTKLGSGGGTCQVSSTTFNILLQLPGIEILQRRPHQQSGAKYLPVGMDAAVGNKNLNLRFQNNYPFAIRMEATSQDGALTLVMYKAD